MFPIFEEQVPLEGKLLEEETSLDGIFEEELSLEEDNMERRMGCDRDKLIVVLFRTGLEMERFLRRLDAAANGV